MKIKQVLFAAGRRCGKTKLTRILMKYLKDVTQEYVKPKFDINVTYEDYQICIEFQPVIQQRVSEIGIRKLLDEMENDIIKLLKENSICNTQD